LYGLGATLCGDVCFATDEFLMSEGQQSVEELVSEFSDRVRARGSRLTNQRVKIAKMFYENDEHVSIDELYARVRDAHPEIGYATVYRTLKLMVDCEMATAHQFDSGRLRFERYHEDEHHDHLICTECNGITEFEDDRIEELQEEVARKLGFQLTSHKMELYGICKLCQGS